MHFRSKCSNIVDNANIRMCLNPSFPIYSLPSFGNTEIQLRKMDSLIVLFNQVDVKGPLHYKFNFL